jgi:hypothetical protein
LSKIKDVPNSSEISLIKAAGEIAPYVHGLAGKCISGDIASYVTVEFNKRWRFDEASGFVKSL